MLLFFVGLFLYVETCCFLVLIFIQDSWLHIVEVDSPSPNAGPQMSVNPCLGKCPQGDLKLRHCFHKIPLSFIVVYIYLHKN